MKISVFLIFDQNIDCRYTLEPPSLQTPVFLHKSGIQGRYSFHGVMYDSYLLKDVHSVLVNFPREYAQESMMLYI